MHGVYGKMIPLLMQGSIDMDLWKRNLIFCWFGMFVTGIGMSMIAPVLPLYIEHIGIEKTALIEQLSGIAFGATFIISAIFSPVWGLLADKYGRKPMLLRASLGMAVVIFCMGFTRNVYQLIGLRLFQGVITGYSTACTTLIATQTDKEHAGYALGLLSTSNIAGSLIGPTIGGFIAENLGMRNVFFLTGALMFVAFLLTLFFVKENFMKDGGTAQSLKEVWESVSQKKLTMIMFATSFTLSAALYTVEPIVTVYVGQLSEKTVHVALISGLIFSVSGLANILAAPRLGKLSDKIGVHKIMVASLIAAGVIFIPQAFVRNPWELMFLRFLLGLTMAGLNPSVNVVVKKITPDALTGRVFGLNISAQYLGVFSGSIAGGQIAAHAGLKYVFFFTSALLLANALWIYLKVYKKINVKS